MEWRWPEERRWRRAATLRAVRECALRSSRPPLVQIRDHQGDPAGWLLAVGDETPGAAPDGAGVLDAAEGLLDAQPADAESSE